MAFGRNMDIENEDEEDWRNCFEITELAEEDWEASENTEETELKPYVLTSEIKIETDHIHEEIISATNSNRTCNGSDIEAVKIIATPVKLENVNSEGVKSKIFHSTNVRLDIEEGEVRKYRQNKKRKGSTKPEKQYKCNFCKKLYSVELRLRAHKERHIKKKPHKCLYCKECFYDKLVLQRHMLKHLNSYECDSCGLSFSFLSKLNYHKNLTNCKFITHRNNPEINKLEIEETKPFKCSFCGFGYSTFGELRSHMKMIH